MLRTLAVGRQKERDRPLVHPSCWAVLGLVLLTSCGDAAVEEGARARGGRSQPPSLVLISVDTLRADHLGCYGYERDTSPNLDRLAAEGVLFENAFSPSSWTLPGHATMLTGHDPYEHEATDPSSPIDEDVPLLAERLRARGFRTVAVVNGIFLKPKFGFERGFERYEVFPALDTSAHHEAVLEILREPDARPSFVFLHYMRVHAPYRGPPSGSPFGRGGKQDASPPLSAIIDEWKARGVEGPLLLPEEREQLVALYDGGILAMDRMLGEVLAALDSPRWKDTVVILTSDHGEEFLEHDFLGHSFTLYDEVIQVPLIVRGPGVPAGGRVEAMAGLVDVVPTALDLLGFGTPDVGGGRSLRPLWAARGTARDAPDRNLLLHTRFPLGGDTVLGVRGEEAKLIVHPGEGRTEFYALERDPNEQHSRPSSPRVERLEERLDSELEATGVEQVVSPGPATGALRAKELVRLRRLGYVDPEEEGSGRAATDRPHEEGPASLLPTQPQE